MSHFDITSDTHPEVVQRICRLVRQADPESLGWYDRAHDHAVALGLDLGIGTKRAAGILAAVSPALDAATNFDAIHDILGDRDHTHVTSRQRVKALRCLIEDPTDVLNPRTGPKTWAFFWNIWQPRMPGHVTVDGRHADVIYGRMRPWKRKRGIDVGGPGTRYESYEFVTEDAARWLRRRCRGYRSITPAEVQAAAWCEAKRIELSGPHCRGLARQQGPPRQGQEYI